MIKSLLMIVLVLMPSLMPMLDLADMVVWERLARKISTGKPATSTALMVFIVHYSVFRIVILLGLV
jgi:hypothetical protein